MAESKTNHSKTALVTGAARGIGFDIAKQLAGEGMAVAIADLDADDAASAAERIASASGSRAIGVAMNVADKDSIDAGIAEIRGSLAMPDILVNNAGIYRSTPLLEIDAETWQLMIDIMLTGPLLLSQAVIPRMIDLQWGRIINLGSLVGATAFGEDVGYSVAKAGIAGMTRTMAMELAKHQICVNTVCPGNILTEMLKDTGAAIEKRDGLEPGQFIRERGSAIPLGRLGEPPDIANLIVFLASTNADYITGQSIHVNGGLFQT